MLIPVAKQGLVLIGAGPAGLAPLLAAASAGRLHELLRLGVTVLERGEDPGSGTLGDHAITSDSSAEAFLDIVIRSREPKLQALLGHPVTQELLRLGKDAAPLVLVSKYLGLVGKVLCELVLASPRGQLLTGTEALHLTEIPSIGWRVRCRDVSTGTEHEVEARFVVVATGAHQPQERLSAERVAGVALSAQYANKLVQSGDVLGHLGVTRVRNRLANVVKPKIVVIGGSTSAGSVAACLLRNGQLPSLGEQGLTLMHRQPLRIFYESVADAEAERYNEFSSEDVCPLTGRVYRFSGFRLDSRELIMRARGIGNRPEEPRLRLFQLGTGNTGEARTILESADLIIAAFGYRPKVLPVFDDHQQEIPILSPGRGRWSIVDGQCRLLTNKRVPLDNLFAIGLAVGPSPDPSLGGETGFRGQVNSLWMWQHVLGLRIVDQICSQALSISNRGSYPSLSADVPTGSSPASTALPALVSMRAGAL